MSKLPVTEIKDLATAVALTLNAVDAVAQGRDLGDLVAIVKAARAYADVDFAQILPQASDIDAEEAKDLAAHFAQVFNITNDSIEVVVEQGLSIVLQSVEAIKVVWELVQKIRGSVA